MTRRTRVFLALLIAVTAVAAILLYGLLYHPSLEPYRHLEFAPSQASAGGVRATFLGTSTLLMDDDETAVLVDGFISRPRRLDSLIHELRPDMGKIKPALGQVEPGRLSAVLVAHAHYDHAMDSATIVKRWGGWLIGSESVRIIGHGEGLRYNVMPAIKTGVAIERGKFTITPYRSPHSPGWLFRFPGEITASWHPPARMWKYREGSDYSFLIERGGLKILVHPSANFYPCMYKGVQADIVFLGIGRLGKQDEQFADDYWREVVMTTGAKLVIPIHWDDFTLPLDWGLRPMPPLLDNFDLGMQRILSMADREPKVSVRLMRAFQTIELTSEDP